MAADRPDLGPEEGDYETGKARRAKRRAERELKDAGDRVEDIQEDLGDVEEKLADVEEKLAKEDLPDKKRSKLLRKKQGLLDEKGELEKEAEGARDAAKKKIKERAEDEAGKDEKKSKEYRQDEKKLAEVNAKIEAGGLTILDEADLLDKRAELEKKLKRKPGKAQAAKRAREQRELAEAVDRAGELDGLDDELGDDLDDAFEEGADEGEGEEVVEGEEGIEEGDEKAKGRPDLAERLSGAAKGLCEGVVLDLHDRDDVVKQAFVTGKSFLIMLLVGKGGKNAEWLTNFTPEDLDTLEAGIGMKVKRNEEQKAKVEDDDGGVLVEWVDPQPENLPPTKAFKVYKGVFGPNWSKTEAGEIRRSTTLQDLQDKLEGGDEEEMKELQQLVDGMLAVDPDLDGKTKVVDFLEDNHAAVLDALGIEVEEIELSFEGLLGELELTEESNVSKLIALIPDGDDSFNETKALISEHKNGDEDLTMSGLHDKISELGEPALNGFLRSLRSIADLREVEETVETDGSGEEDETPTEMEDDGAGEVEEDEIETAPEPEIESAAAPVVQPPTSPIADLRRDGGLSPLS